MADLLEMDLGKVMEEKLARNEERYPVSKAKGNNRKYNEFE
jgi:hypothetical protein